MRINARACKIIARLITTQYGNPMCKNIIVLNYARHSPYRKHYLCHAIYLVEHGCIDYDINAGNIQGLYNIYCP